MQRDLKGLWRCMGGRFCNHTPGTCTATVGRHAPEPEGRRMSDELVEAVAEILRGADMSYDEDFGVVSIDNPDALARAAIAVVIERCAKVAETAAWNCEITERELYKMSIRKLGESDDRMQEMLNAIRRSGDDVSGTTELADAIADAIELIWEKLK